MKQFNSVDEILAFAISQEEAAAKWYMELAGRMEKPWMRQVFEDFAGEERGHRRKLLEIKEGKILFGGGEKVADLKLADYVVAGEPTGEMDYQDALILAMKKEKAAFKLYTDLAASVEEPELKVSLLALAQEEAKHKLRFEIEYDDLLEEGSVR